MFRKIIEIITALLLMFNSAYSQAPAIQWQRCFGGTGSEICFSADATSDNGSICLGSRKNLTNGDISEPTHGSDDFWVVKLDAAGNKSWDKTLGGSADERGFGIQQTSDGGYIVVGSTTSNNTGDVGLNHGGYDYWVVKLNGTGMIEWQKTFGGTGDDIANAVQQTSDGGYIVAGESYSSDGDITGAHGDRDYWVIKLNNLGNLTWQKSLGGSGIDFMPTIKQTTGGGYILTGSTSSSDGDVSNPNHVFGIAWIVKLNSIGNIEWQKTYGSLNNAESGVGICQTSDGGYAATGICYANSGNVTGNHGNSDFWVIKLDAVGNLLWQKSLGGSIQDEPKSIIQSDDGGLVVTGWTASSNGNITSNLGGNDYWVVKLSSGGNLLWQKTMGGSSLDQSYCIVQVLDHGFVIVGNTVSNNTGDVGSNHGSSDIWVVKLAPEDVVPVTLSEFDAVLSGRDAVCEWKTSQEQNSSYFIIERSMDATNFTDAGKVLAGGNSSLPIYYNFTDKDVLQLNTDYLFYRLKMVDIDGSFNYSNTVSIKINDKHDLEVYPNPVVDAFTLSFHSETSEKSMVIIFNSAGIKVCEQPVAIATGNNAINIDVHALPAGNYFVRLKTTKPHFSRFVRVGK